MDFRYTAELSVRSTDFIKGSVAAGVVVVVVVAVVVMMKILH